MAKKASDENDERDTVIRDEAAAEKAFQKTQKDADGGTAVADQPVIYGNEMPGEVEARGPGQPPIKAERDLKTGDVNVAIAWLADANEVQAVLMRGDHASPVLTVQLLLEAIPVVQALVDSTSNIDSRRGKKSDS